MTQSHANKATLSLSFLHTPSPSQPQMRHRQRWTTWGGQEQKKETRWAYEVRPLYFFLRFILLTLTQQHSRRTHRDAPSTPPFPSPTRLTPAGPNVPFHSRRTSKTCPGRHVFDVRQLTSVPMLPNTLPLLLHMLDTKNTPNVACFWCLARLLPSPSSRTPETRPCGRVSGV